MSLVRFAARSLFSSWFIVDGIEAFRKTEERASQAESATEKTVPLVQRVVPASYSSSVPERAETWVRIGGACKVLGGLMYATGIGRRLGAALLVPAAALDVAIAAPSGDASEDEKKAGRAELVKRLALVGGAVLGVLDLQGRPSLGWRADNRMDATAKKAQKAAKKARKAAKKQAKKVTS